MRKENSKKVCCNESNYNQAFVRILLSASNYSKNLLGSH